MKHSRESLKQEQEYLYQKNIEGQWVRDHLESAIGRIPQ
jgi:hypothetical protein